MIPNRFGDNDSKNKPEGAQSPQLSELVSWVSAKVRRGRDVRDEMYGQRWKEYTRLWRGFWAEEDKNTNSERSKIIAPATMQAVDMTVSEMEEAVFGRKAWFDIDDDIADEQKDDATAYRDQLLEDFELNGVPATCSEVFLNGALYGTGIAVINVGKKMMPVYDGTAYRMEEMFYVTLEPVRPDEFIIDPAARNIEDALFVAREIIKPIHTVKEKQAAGKYLKGPVGAWNSGIQQPDTTGTGVNGVQLQDEGCLITEYYGKVPARMLPDSTEKGGMVEAIVVIANEGTLLRAVKSPFTHKDRPVIAYQHDVVPGEFWGRGVVEKGYNPQKALDAEMRARMDALALTTAPMLGADVTRLPRNPDLRVRPGKLFLTRGRPSEILEPVGFSPQGLALTFQQTGDLERMVQMGTGAMDTATPNNISRRNETASGMSMLQSGFIKRSKRTMQNVERKFLDKLVQKSLWRYMQFDPSRYPADMKFVVNSAMGIMAKEIENQQLIQMLSFVPPESPAHMIVLRAIFENAVSDHKKDLHEAIKAMSQPPSPEEQQQAQMVKQLQLENAQLENEKLKAEIAKMLAEQQLAQAKAQHEAVNTELEDDRLEIAAANAVTGAEKARMAREQNTIAAAKVKVEARKVEKMGSKSNAKS